MVPPEERGRSGQQRQADQAWVSAPPSDLDISAYKMGDFRTEQVSTSRVNGADWLPAFEPLTHSETVTGRRESTWKD